MLTNYDECHTFLKLVIILSFMKKTSANWTDVFTFQRR
ncbi:hypothetical protein SGADD02_00588 [Streptococcus gallolyticus]|uniref:Uncharacterized protein n=1 Tax=Streptococcus gallolyticus TaxID=315405 RepID=A0A139QWP6_9STRE|nr:hypothetical protein SGADD02_00588 [Streptococcus gallolyticus]KXU06962.1 hypothetical protein SGADD03_01257 [Streptococcus gallolyticus]